MSRKAQISCDNCGKQGAYSEIYDSMFCRKCNIWLQTTCNAENCLWCRTRPERPIPDNDIGNMFDNLVEEL